MLLRIVLAALFAPMIAVAEVSAILIGVSDYMDPEIEDLKGPGNDVALMREVLERRGVTQIDILADDVDGAEDPTRAAILAALAAKAQTVGAGDFVYIHFSGHGTQQKDPDGDETDGVDEVLLPRDAGRADAETGLIANAIVDDEIGRAVDLIRAKGASVWLVLDSCHAGSGLRAGTPGVATRYVDPAVLGADVARGGPVPEAEELIGLPTGGGGVMAFYAAQSSEVAREIDVGDGQFFGLFSAKLAARLDGGANQSFRQLFQATMRDMNDTSVPGAARLQTPLWSGDLIDATVFGDASTASLRRFEVRDGTLQAGLVHGLSDGTLIGLVADVADPADAIVGLAQMETTQANFAFLQAVGKDCVPMAGQLCDSTGPLPPEARFGQVVARPVDLVIGFRPPVDFATGETLRDDHPARQALVAAVADTTSAEVSNADFDVDVTWDGAALWFGPRSTLQERLIGRRWAPRDGDLGPVIAEISKAETLARMLGGLTGGTSILNPNPVEVQATVAPVSVQDILPEDTDTPPRQECQRAVLRRDPSREASLADGMDLKQCDGIAFQAAGTEDGARDVNKVHIDAAYCVHNEYARVEGTAAATPIGRGMTICSNCPGGYSAGEERLFLIVSEVAPNSPPLNLTGLIENCGVDAGTRGTSDARSVLVDDFLQSLRSGAGTRGNFGSALISQIWVDQYRWTVMPKSLVLGGADE